MKRTKDFNDHNPNFKRTRFDQPSSSSSSYNNNNSNSNNNHINTHHNKNYNRFHNNNNNSNNNSNKPPYFKGGNNNRPRYSNPNHNNSNYSNNNSNNYNNYSRSTSLNNINNNNNNNNNNFGLSRSTSQTLNQENTIETINKYVWDHFGKNAQTYECYQKKQELRDALFATFQGVFPYLGIYIVGSSANGFGTNTSDVDICFMVSHDEIERNEALELLKMINKSLRRAGFIKKSFVINAKVPIIKFYDCYGRIDCDININNHIGIRNTHLLKCYSDLDWRVRPLVLMVKSWAKFHNINDAANQTVSSYSLVLMTIFYLQNVCNPPILPVLQKLYPDKFNVRSDITQLNLNETIEGWKSSNDQPLGELFLGFLQYYSTFDYWNNVISIRTGLLVPREHYLEKSEDRSTSSWKYLCIEEPFELTNTARSVYEYSIFQDIIQVFKKSYETLAFTKNMEDLFRKSFYVKMV